MDEFDYYLKNAEENLQSSIALLNIGKYRNSISLSYYAMFLVAKGLIISNGSKCKTHSGVKTEFSKMFVMPGIFNKEMYIELSRSETLRNQADYDVTIDFNEKIAKERIESSIKFINTIKDYMKK